MMKITVDLIKNYQEYLTEEEKSRSTIEKYIRDISAFEKWVGDMELSKIKVLDYLEQGQAVVKLKGKIRVVIFTKELCKVLKRYAEERGINEGIIFITRTGKAVDRYSIWKSMKKLCESAGVNSKKVFPHNLRHLFARTFYGIQKDIVRLADILGHSSVNTTRIYTIENGDMHRIQMHKLGLVRMNV